MDFPTLIKSHPFVLVDFYATWCSPCALLDTILKEVSIHFEDRLKIVKIDVEEHLEIAQAYSIQSIPQLFLFKDGDLIWRYKGFMNTQDTIQLLEKYATLESFPSVDLKVKEKYQ